MISKETIEAVKSTVNLADIISEKVDLKRRGSSLIGLCPFHVEKSGSFHVNANNDYYHCFGCGASGNVFSFVMQTLGLSFPESIEYLAQKANISIQYVEGSKKEANDNSSQKKDLFKINLIAQKFFKKSLDAAPQSVVQYLKERELTKEAIEIFQIGFAPDNWNSLPEFLSKSGVPEELQLASGLVRRNSKGELYSFLRGRLVFPIQMDNNRILSFGARVIPALFSNEDLESQAKYINGSESPIYSKNQVLFGMNLALNAIRQERHAFIVEGYFDVLGMHLGGLQNAVATCGTALTENHIKRLSRIVTRVSLLFDGDAAGRDAAARAFPLFINSGLDAKVLFLPQGEDPHSLYLKVGTNLKKEIAALESRSLLHAHLSSILTKEGVQSFSALGPAASARISSQIAKEIIRAENPVEREIIEKEAAFLLNLSEATRRELFSNSKQKNEPKPVAAIENREVTSSTTTTAALSQIDRDIIRAVFVLKEKVTEIILNDSSLCTNLTSQTLFLIQSISQICSDDSINADDKKMAIRSATSESGFEFINLWKQAREMQKLGTVDFAKVLSECQKASQKNELLKVMAALDERLAKCTDDVEKAQLSNEKLKLARSLRG